MGNFPAKTCRVSPAPPPYTHIFGSPPKPTSGLPFHQTALVRLRSEVRQLFGSKCRDLCSHSRLGHASPSPPSPLIPQPGFTPHGAPGGGGGHKNPPPKNLRPPSPCQWVLPTPPFVLPWPPRAMFSPQGGQRGGSPRPPPAPLLTAHGGGGAGAASAAVTAARPPSAAAVTWGRAQGSSLLAWRQPLLLLLLLFLLLFLLLLSQEPGEGERSLFRSRWRPGWGGGASRLPLAARPLRRGSSGAR